MPARLKSGDEVIVIGGKDRGKRGKILRVEPKHQRVYIEGLNMIKRHQKPRQVAGAQRAEQVGGVIEREGPIHVSNVMLVDPKEGNDHARRRRGSRRQAPARLAAQRNEARLMTDRSAH